MTITTFHTQAEVARILGVKPQNVDYWARTGKIDYVEADGGKRFRYDEILRLLQERKEEAMVNLVSLGLTMRDLAKLAEMIDASK